MTQEVSTVAKHISDLGMMAVTAAFFLVLTAALWIACFKWFKNIIDNMIKGNAAMIKDLLTETRKQNDMLNDISEGLRPETKSKIETISAVYFDLAIEKVMRIIKRIIEENHISDREGTQEKIKTLLENLHEERKSKLENFSFRGKKASEYVNPDWVKMVSNIVEKEVYNPEKNYNRTYTNVKAIYEKIKNDFNYRANHR